MTFKSKLNLSSIRGTNKWRLEERLVYTGSSYIVPIAVPTGFITDFASIPKYLRFIIDNDDPIIRDGAVIHDYLYSICSNLKYSRVTRKIADDLLFDAMIDLGATRIKAYTAYYAVRLFGGLFYKKGKVHGTN